MVRKYFFLASVAFGLTAVAAQKDVAEYSDVVRHATPTLKAADFVKSAVARQFDGSTPRSAAKAPSTSVEWKRPAGQFWGTGYCPEINKMGFFYTPLVIRPWVEYTFENISTATGTGTFTIQNWSNQEEDWLTTTSREKEVKVSYLRYERANAPRLSYRGQVTYPTQFSGEKETYNETDRIGYIAVNPDLEIRINTEYGDNVKMPVSSHYWSGFTRNETDGGAQIRYTGAPGYPGMEDEASDGLWFGTNARGINAAATRFEKPDMPYLLNGVYWYYIYNGDIPKEIPLKAYVVKTANDAKIEMASDGETPIETLEIGDIIATAEAVVPVTANPSGEIQYASVAFEFKEKNPVTGAENAYSLEIEDDITIIVTGFDADLGNGKWITSTMSLDEFDEGYGNLGFLGRFNENEDGTIDYSMNALKNFFVSEIPNTVLGVLADVSYPWLSPYYDYPSEIKLANEGETTDDEIGLQASIVLLASSMTEDFEIYFDGEDECDWLQVIDVYDEMEQNEDGDEEFAGISIVTFEAAPNPNDENRTCKVKISIPAASYEITFLQGTNNNAVDIVSVEKNVEYYDLQGRRVVNPDKGIYVKKTGNKAEKVIF